jgi:hypothetical protein
MAAMRRSILATLLAFALIGISVGSVSAGKPLRGCADDFERMPYLDFRAYLLSDAFLDSLSPEGQALAVDFIPFIESEDWIAVSDGFDKNGDGILCIKQNPPTKGNLYGWVFNGVDNTSNH